jgi:mono/diheme cytochrome c family protein
MVKKRSFFTLSLLFLTPLFLFGCQPGLEQQPKIKDDAAAEFFADQSGNRAQIPGTVTYLAPSAEQPKLTRALLVRGEERYEIYCSVCHGLTGEGNGMAIQRGFPAPTSFLEEKLTQKTADQFFHSISVGAGAMLGFSNRLSIEDRWAVSFYLKALQLRAHFPKKRWEQLHSTSGGGS